MLVSSKISFTTAAGKFQKSDFPFSNNLAIASVEKTQQKKGATSTFIGININDDRRLKFIGCGDSNIFIFKDNDFTGFPFFDLLELDSNKSFLNTEQLNPI